MKKTTLAAVLLAAGLLAGCGGDKKEIDRTDAASTPAPAKGDDKAASLKRAIQGYVDAQLSGDVVGVTGYLSPEKCTDDDKGSAAMAAGYMKDTAKGAKMKITGVKIEGDRGTYTTYELSSDAPDALRRLLKTSDKEHADEMGWAYIDGEWYRDGGCDGPGASASPTP